ncbi:MAG: hypothetical protein IJM24_02245 [Clostridia bacterium]|nr:hypothetical protein [Clostridia bacterium]
MKKIIVLLLTFVMIAALAACAPKTPSEGDKATEVPATAVPATEAPTAAPTAAPTEVPTEAPTEEPAPQYTIPYVTDGLVALFEGYYNTRKGQNKSTEIWDDLSGNGIDIDFMLDDTAEWTDKGLAISSTRIEFPDELFELINGEEFTVEYSIDDLVVTGADFATLLNVLPNDQFALFIRNSNGAIEFKTAPANARPQKAGVGVDSVNNKTIAVTFKLGDKICLYSNGELLSSVEAKALLGATSTFFIGHNDAKKSYDATVRSIRFYDRALSAEELAANAAAVGTLGA